MHSRLPLLIIASLFILLFSCRKERFTEDPGARLQFSADTIKFDTVFVSTGSATKNFKVKNTNKQAVKISHIRLAGGAASQFRINIDGRPTTFFDDYELAAGDSFFIFVEVTVDPNNQATPFIVSDSILFETNGSRQQVQLQAFGQNAHFVGGKVLSCDAIWTNDLPYVVYSTIGVAEGCKLTIQKGVKVYLHKNTGILVAGILEINGTKDEPVVLRGDRLEKAYEDEPGQWYGIRILPKSMSNKITHAIIDNGVIGIEVDSLPLTAGIKNLTIEKSIIRNMTAVGLLGYSASIDGKNVLIHSCGQATFIGDLGGNYRFTHCTFENSNTVTARRTASIWLTNTDYVDEAHNIHMTIDLNAEFRNCILWGSIDDEVKLVKDGGGSFTSLFDHNLIKATEVKFDASNLINKNPRFKDPFDNKYELDTLSPAQDYGILLPPPFTTPDDLDENIRDNQPDLGCYERIK